MGRLSPEPRVDLGIGHEDAVKEETRDVITVQESTVVVDTSIALADNDASADEHRAEPLQGAKGAAAATSTPNAFRNGIPIAIPTSPLSSPPAEIIPPSVFRSSTRSRFFGLGLPLSSSPLSSPPPILDYSISTSDTSPSRRSSTSQSDLDDTLSSNPFSMSQGSSQGRSSLPNMKGKDLFDASIWADPLRTSVFYTFATSLRKKIRDCEPTSSHRFISHLRDRGKLVRCYTQNIDQIEEKVGLSTSLEDGPGSRGRFSRRSTANATQLSKMVAGDGSAGASVDDGPGHGGDEPSRPWSAKPDPAANEGDACGKEAAKVSKPVKLERSKSSGVECVFLHGSLESLRCFLCGRVSSWDDALVSETLTGQQPECPHCIGATTARQERGKRALGVGKLRPDIVLYGEEHPNAHLISPIVTHDISLCPDLLLILGTSLRVHGLKVLVREFAKAIHSRGGTVIFVNFTKPSESSWGDIIDYWVQWDCDAWVADLQGRVPKLWEEPSPPRKKKAKKTEEELDREKRERPPPANPVAMRDTRLTGAYWSLKIRDELYRITGTQSLQLRAVEPAAGQTTARRSKKSESRRTSASSSKRSSLITEDGSSIAIEAQPGVQTEAANHAGSPTEAESPARLDKPTVAQRATKAKPGRPRKSATGASEKKSRKPPSTLNPQHGRATKPQPLPPAVESTGHVEGQLASPLRDTMTSINSILNSVKERPRIRKRKKIDGEEIVLPRTKARRSQAEHAFANQEAASVTLAPLTNTHPPTPPQLDRRPRPMEPSSSPLGPVARISAGLCNAYNIGHQAAAYFKEALDLQAPWRGPPRRFLVYPPSQAGAMAQQGLPMAESDVAMTLTRMGATHPPLR